MTLWHVWGDYVHTMPEEIGGALLLRGHEDAAKATARLHGFDFHYRLRNGFEPWSAAFATETDDPDQDFEFASYPTVRGWQRLG